MNNEINYKKLHIKTIEYLQNRKKQLLKIIKMVEYKDFSLACLYEDLKVTQELIDEIEQLKGWCFK